MWLGLRYQGVINVEIRARYCQGEVLDQGQARLRPERFAGRSDAARDLWEAAGDIVGSQIPRRRAAARAPINIKRVVPNVQRLTRRNLIAQGRGDDRRFVLAAGHPPSFAE